VKLNPVEKLLVNSPLRALWLRASVGWLYDAACGPPVTRMLEVGCGQGDAVRELVPRFHPRVLDAFDLDPAQLARARTRLAGAANGAQVRLWVGDAERIAAPDGHYDAVLELAILHHVPDWRAALAEIRRVLRPGGMFLFEELSREFFRDVPVLSGLLRRFTVHPWDTMFEFPAFRSALADVGLRVTALRTHPLPGWHQGVAVRD